MTYSFTYNPESAKKADEGGLIDKTGKYVAWIIDAEYITSKQGTKGITFDVMTANKETTSFTLYYEKADGTPLFGADKINAILACLGLKGLSSQQKNLKRYDYQQGGKIDKQCWVAPELHKQKIGLLLQRENYQKNDGSWGYAMTLYACFQADTELMAGEIVKGLTKAEALPKVLERLINMGDKQRQAQQQSQSFSGGYNHNQYTDNGYALNQGFVNQQQNNDPEDDLPF